MSTTVLNLSDGESAVKVIISGSGHSFLQRDKNNRLTLDLDTDTMDVVKVVGGEIVPSFTMRYVCIDTIFGKKMLKGFEDGHQPRLIPFDQIKYIEIYSSSRPQTCRVITK